MNDLFNQETENNDMPPFDFPAHIDIQYKKHESLPGYVIKIPDGELFYDENFFSRQYSDRCIAYFLENRQGLPANSDWHKIDQESLSKFPFTNIHWRHDKLKMYGKVVYLPRYSAWYGDNDAPYTYSGLALQPNPWNKGLLDIKQRIENVTTTRFNSVLMNWYRDGADYINWHTDAEKELGQNPVIASANFGSTRRFLIRRIDDHKCKIEIPLKHGTLLIMKGKLQHYWQHSVPKQKSITQARFNLTFRRILHNPPA